MNKCSSFHTWPRLTDEILYPPFYPCHDVFDPAPSSANPTSEGAESADEFVGDDRLIVDDLVSEFPWLGIIYC